MNKNIKLAVAGAVLALSASAANAGIVIPAGDWTLDIGGNVNMFSAWTKSDAQNTVKGGLTGYFSGKNTSNNMTTGLLPNFLSVSGTTRQNDLDVSFTISLQPGSSAVGAIETGNSGINNRQSFITFGDKSWGSVKVGKDLGIFASDAILSDMTLLGVGAPTSAGNNTTLGRIGAGYIYADCKPQIAYTTPNLSGFQATAGITQNFAVQSNANTAATNTTGAGAGAAAINYSATSSNRSASPAYEGKASYSFAANDVTGKIWVSGIANKVNDLGAGVTVQDSVAYAGDIGATVSAAGFGLTGYYYHGSGMGTTGQMWDGYSLDGKTRDSDGGYVQATYVLPTKTKVGISWGISNLDKADGEVNTVNAAGATTANARQVGNLVQENEMWTGGIYHPLTKHLNLVAEYSYLRSTNQADKENKNYTGSLGAILFF